MGLESVPGGPSIFPIMNNNIDKDFMLALDHLNCPRLGRARELAEETLELLIDTLSSYYPNIVPYF